MLEKALWLKRSDSFRVAWPRLHPSRSIPEDRNLGVLRGDDLLKGILQRLRQKFRDLTRGHDDPNRLAGEVIRLHSQGLYANAAIVARRLAELQRERLGPRRLEYAAALSNLGLLLQRQGNLDEAEALLEETLDIRREALGESDPLFASSLIHLADIHQARDALHAAEPLIRQALEIQKRVLGPSHPDLASSLTSHALLLDRKGEAAAAEGLLRQALAIRKQNHGENHPLYATSLSNLALFLSRNDDPAAEGLLQQTLTIRNEALGANHPDSVESREYLEVLAEKRQPAGTPPEISHNKSHSPLESLAAEYAAISQALADLGRSYATSELVPILDQAERCLRTLKSIHADNKLPSPQRGENDQRPDEERTKGTPIETNTPYPKGGEGGRRPDEGGKGRDRAKETEGIPDEGGKSRDRTEKTEQGPNARVIPAVESTAESIETPPIPTKPAPHPTRLQALSILDRILAAKPRKPGLTEMFDAYRESANLLREQLSVARKEITKDDLAIVELSHPVTALFRLANSETLSNQHWLEVYTLASESFGKPLANAASQGQIDFPS